MDTPMSCIVHPSQERGQMTEMSDEMSDRSSSIVPAKEYKNKKKQTVSLYIWKESNDWFIETNEGLSKEAG